MIAEQSRTKLTENIARIAQLKFYLPELKGKLCFSKHHSNVAGLWYPMLSDACDSLNCQFASDGVCSEEIIRWLTNLSKGVDAFIDHLNLYGAHAQGMVRDTFFNKFVALANCLHTFLQHEISTFSNFVNEAASDAVTSLQDDVAHYQSTVRERLERLAGLDNAQGGPSVQCGPPHRSVESDSGSYDRTVVHLWYCSLKKSIENLKRIVFVYP